MTRAERSLAAAIRGALRTVADFPRAGIAFQDIGPVLSDGSLFRQAVEAMAAPYVSLGVTHVAAIESRGFLFGAPVATLLCAGLIPLRKAGKLPGTCLRVDYALEYGVDALEAQQDAVRPGARVVVVDDVLATGGTALAACALVERGGAAIAGCSFLLEIAGLAGQKALAGRRVDTVLAV